MPRKRTWTEDQLRKSAKEVTSYGQLLRRLGLRYAGGNYTQIRQYIKELKIDISHFKGRAWNKGMRGIGKSRIPLEKILVKGSLYQSFKLKNRLFKVNLKPQYCEMCRWAEKTPSGYLPLELDHINGDHYDNRIENLRVLCPNCHSLTPHHRGRAGKGKPKKNSKPGWRNW